ncbi:hypothetical protein K0M31_011115 [Melipona bicolor]|uniref:Uncharacterized protein n=1 Tax=Melipona bicolor TaxID=60889 RepID=A0AA40G909_9HYME|nr:hypothetical protein K0M31_011115 [Melipona bicolor]
MSDCAYESNWYNVSPSEARCLLFIMNRSTRPLCLTAGKFGTFSMEMFSTRDVMTVKAQHDVFYIHSRITAERINRFSQTSVSSSSILGRTEYVSSEANKKRFEIDESFELQLQLDSRRSFCCYFEDKIITIENNKFHGEDRPPVFVLIADESKEFELQGLFRFANLQITAIKSSKRKVSARRFRMRNERYERAAHDLENQLSKRPR